jgi:hypothetical protein
MPRIRKVGKYGGTWVIKLSHFDVKDFDIQDDDEYDIENMLLLNKIKKKKKK